MILKITKQDINGAMRGNALRCPIARAIERTIGGAPRVLPTYVQWQDAHGQYQNARLSTRACLAIERFDARRGMKPFNIRLDLKA